MKRKVLTITALLVVALFLVGGIVYAAQNISINIDGRAVESDVAPQVVSGRTLVPLRAISEHFGAEVGWVQESMSVEITSPSQKFLDDYTNKAMYIKQASEILPMYNAGTALILDVRSPALRGHSYIAGSMYIPMPELLERIDEIPTDKAVAVYCAKNINAAYAVAILTMQGYDAYLLENGMDAWRTAGGRITICSR